MAFDADAYVNSREPWELTIGGQTYTARPISAPAVLAFYQKATSGALSNGAAEQAVKKLLRSVFPWRPHYAWRGDPVARVAALDADAQRAVLDDFFGYVRRWSERRQTNGTNSSPKTPQPTPKAAATE